eukprot:4837717-Amphidinium_carterae.1
MEVRSIISIRRVLWGKGLVVLGSSARLACVLCSALLQDIRSVLSFMLGALLCCTLTRGREDGSVFQLQHALSISSSSSFL